MFPIRRVKFVRAFGTSPRYYEHEDPRTHVVAVEYGECNKPLPAREMFAIQNQLKAGVTLNEVPTAVVQNVDTKVMNTLGTEVETRARRRSKKVETANDGDEK